MKAKKYRSIINILAIMVLAACITGCRVDAKTTTAEKSKIPCMLRDLGERIETGEVTIDTATVEIQLSGRVSFNEDKVVPFTPMISGNVSGVNFSLGDHVRKGQVMAVIQSAELEDLHADLESAQLEVTIAQRTYRQKKDLFESGISSERDYLQASNDLSSAKRNVDRLGRLLEIYGGDANSSQHTILAPATGYVVQKNINPGMQLQPGNTAFTISGLDEVWVLADVYESDLASIRAGQPVKVETHAYPGMAFAGKIDNISNVLDPETRTLRVRISLQNDGKLLKPGIFARVLVENKTGSKKHVIPSNSLIFDRNRHFVIMANDDCQPETREVRIFAHNGERAYISEGLQEGERLVTKKQLLIYNALNY